MSVCPCALQKNVPTDRDEQEYGGVPLLPLHLHIPQLRRLDLLLPPLHHSQPLLPPDHQHHRPRLPVHLPRALRRLRQG